MGLGIGYGRNDDDVLGTEARANPACCEHGDARPGQTFVSSMFPVRAEFVQAWSVHRHNDDRNNGPITELCVTRELAGEVAYKSGYYGGDAPVEAQYVVVVGGVAYLLDKYSKGQPTRLSCTLDEVRAAQAVKLRENALAKLTPEERVALGLP